ncbi:MAG: PQQ-binding-like beta-propeller repeat protein [Bacteroidetes bacterium]|nr:PQQ-binding-like beta-propeller repeat protein [Bacteroidota bacterium]
MKISNWLFAGVILLAMNSCNKDESDNIDKNAHSAVQWTYSLSSSLGTEVVDAALPAFDEKNTGYYLVETDNTGLGDINNRHDVWIFSLRSDSSLHWKVKVNDATTDALDENFVAYANGKVIAFLKEKLVCLDTLNGNIAWSKTINREYFRNSLSIANGKLFYIDQSNSQDKLKGYSLETGSELCSITVNSGTGEYVRWDYTAIAGTKLFVVTSDINNAGMWLSKILIYNISDISNTSVPAFYLLPKDLYPKNTIITTSTGNALFYAKYDMTSPYKKYLVMVNGSGNEVFKKEVPSDAQYIYTDAQDNIYCRTTSDTKIIRFSSNGDKLGEASFPYYDTFGVFEILENNTFYGNAEDAETGLSVVAVYDLISGAEKSRRTVDFPYALLDGNSIEVTKENNRREEENSSFSNSLVRCVDRSGNIISISGKKIYCVKDAERKLLKGAWGKDFANYGNTGSR